MMNCKVCGSAIAPNEGRCKRCRTQIPGTRGHGKDEVRLREVQHRPRVQQQPQAVPQEMEQPKHVEKKGELPIQQPVETIPASTQLQPTVGKLLSRPGKDEEVLDAYVKHISKKLSCVSDTEPKAERCRTVFQRVIDHRNAGEISKALRYAATCILMLEEIVPTRPKVAESGVSPELRKAANSIDRLQKKALESGVNILNSERLRTTAVDAFKMGAIEQGSHLLYKCLDTLSSEVREHILQKLQVYKSEVDKAASLKIDTGTHNALIIEVRLRLGDSNLVSALGFLDELKAATIELREEISRKTNTFDCPVCGMVNPVEAEECQICGTVFPERGPLYRGEKIRVEPPGRKLK